MEDNILTTSQAAKLLGISVRTAQLLIESGSLKSWKTPGGHRRVYRDDILAVLESGSQVPTSLSARVIVLASRENWRAYEESMSVMSECSIDMYSDVYSALFAVGSRLPRAVVVDLNDDRQERLSLLHHLSSNPALGHTHTVAVGGPASSNKSKVVHARTRVESPELLPGVLRVIFGDMAKYSAQFNKTPSFPTADNEGQRLKALERSGLVDTVPEKAFDRLTWLAAHFLKTPIALMTMLTPTRQWFKSRHGLDMVETPRSWAFCNHTILQRDVFSVGNLAMDKRFAKNPAVAGDAHFRFYAGAPVIDQDGFALGSVCVIDREPRKLNQEQTKGLLALAGLASDEVRLRANDRKLRWASAAG
jgi:excisionase family DNA binding protein